MLHDRPAAVYPTQIAGEFSIAETLEVKEGKAISSNHMASDTKGHKGLISEDPGSPPHVGLKSSHHRCPVTFTTKDISVHSCGHQLPACKGTQQLSPLRKATVITSTGEVPSSFHHPGYHHFCL